MKRKGHPQSGIGCWERSEALERRHLMKSLRQQEDRTKRLSKRRSRRHPKGVPRTPDELYAMPKSGQQDWDRTIEGVFQMRRGLSAPKAAKAAGLKYRKFTRLARGALKKAPNGRLEPKRVDRLLRVVSYPTPKGVREMAVRDSREATKLARFWRAVHRFVSRGDARGLREFRGRHIVDANGVGHLLVTDLLTLDRLANAGVLSFESLYRKR